MMKVRTWLLDRGALVALVVAMVYVWVAPAHIVDGDNAEFATLGTLGGAAHPSGYPSYVLWLRLLSWLPCESPAHVTAVSTALLGALTALALHAACRAWGARTLAATVTVALFAAGPVVLRMNTEAEVFAGNQLVVALVLWLSAQQGPLRGVPRAVVLGLVAGLGLANHLTCVLVAPVGILGVVRGAREAKQPVLAVIASVLGLVGGLLPYAYLLVAPDTPLSWGTVRSFDELVAMVMRRDYGGPGAFRVANVEVSTWTSLAAFARTLGRAWLWLPALVGLAALGRNVARPREGETRWAWAMLALAWLVAGPLLVLRFNVPPEGLGLYVCQRFYLLPILLLAIPISIGLSAVTVPRESLLTAVVATLGVAAAFGASLPYVGRVHSPAVERSARNMLGSLPASAVVIHGQDELHAASGYAQAALGVRPDVVVVTWPMMGLRWYRERAARSGVPAGDLIPDPRRFAERVLATGRPLFVDRLQREIISTFPSYPYGVLIRVLPRGTRVPSVHDVLAMNRDVYAHFDLDYHRPGPDDEFATEVHLRYSAIWNMIGQKLAQSGNADAAHEALDTARALAPSP